MIECNEGQEGFYPQDAKGGEASFAPPVELATEA